MVATVETDDIDENTESPATEAVHAATDGLPESIEKPDADFERREGGARGSENASAAKRACGDGPTALEGAAGSSSASASKYELRGLIAGVKKTSSSSDVSDSGSAEDIARFGGTGWVASASGCFREGMRDV